MKKASLLLLVITLTASSFAQTKNMDITTVKKITTDEFVTSLKIYDNVEVILTDNVLNEVQIVGEKSEVGKTLVKFSNGEMTITSSSPDFYKDRVVVYASSKNLASIYIHGSSTVSSLGKLGNEILDIIINGEGKSTIKTTGIINLNTIGNFPLESSSK